MKLIKEAIFWIMVGTVTVLAAFQFIAKPIIKKRVAKEVDREFRLDPKAFYDYKLDSLARSGIVSVVRAKNKELSFEFSIENKLALTGIYPKSVIDTLPENIFTLTLIGHYPWLWPRDGYVMQGQKTFKLTTESYFNHDTITIIKYKVPDKLQYWLPFYLIYDNVPINIHFGPSLK